MITYTQMLQFVTVVRNKSITKAAEELLVAQPAISATIKKIEAELNAPLLTYEKKHLSLTDIGEQVYKIFSEILALYTKLDDITQNNFTDITIRRLISYYASPSIHDYVTPQLQLFDAFPQLDFSIYTCDSLDEFFLKAQDTENIFGIFFVPTTISISKDNAHDFTIENIATVSTTLITSNKNTAALAKKEQLTLEEIKDLPLIRCLGSDLAIQNHLYNADLNYVVEVSEAKQINTILEKRSYLYTIGTNIFFNQSAQKSISIPIKDAPNIYLTLIYKNTANYPDIFKRIASMLRSLYGA